MNELPEIPQIRTAKDTDGELLYSVVSIIEVMDVSKAPRRYWSDLKRRLKTEGFEVYENIVQLKLPASDGKQRQTDCANRETILRILQSISHPSAEQAKQWLAKSGEQQLQELENPDIAMERAKAYYRKKGYSEKWINKRIETKGIRSLLTEEWKERGVKEGKQYADLTNEIHTGAFEMTVGEHKGLKELKRESLRDHMTLTELAITSLGEAATIDIANANEAFGFEENKDAAKEGGDIAG